MDSGDTHPAPFGAKPLFIGLQCMVGHPHSSAMAVERIRIQHLLLWQAYTDIDRRAEYLKAASLASH